MQESEAQLRTNFESAAMTVKMEALPRSHKFGRMILAGALSVFAIVYFSTMIDLYRDKPLNNCARVVYGPVGAYVVVDDLCDGDLRKQDP